MLLASTFSFFFGTFSLATVAVTGINIKIDYFSLYRQNSFLANIYRIADFIGVAGSRCLWEGSRCWVEGQVLPEKLLLPVSSVPLASLLGRGRRWPPAPYGGAAQKLTVAGWHLCEGTAPVARALGKLVRLVTSLGGYGLPAGADGALGLRRDAREIHPPSCQRPWQSREPGCACCQSGASCISPFWFLLEEWLCDGIVGLTSCISQSLAEN